MTDTGVLFVGELSLSEVPLALTPVALPETFEPALLMTVWPVGVSFTTPVRVRMPNVDQLLPGAEAVLQLPDC